MKHLPTLLVLAVLLASARAAAADPSDAARAAASQHYERGLELAGAGDYQGALDEFLAAYETSPHFAVLYNVGQAYISLERPVEAVDALERYLAEGRDRLPAERVARIEQQIAAERAQIAELRISIDAESASIEVDGTRVGSSPLAAPLRVAAGTHLVLVEAPGRPRAMRSVTLSPGQTLDLAIELPEAPSAPMPAPPPQIEPSPMHAASASTAPTAAVPTETAPSAGSDTRWLVYTLAGTGVALGGAALGTYLWNRGRYDSWQAEDDALAAERVSGSYEQRQLANNELGASIDRVESVTLGLAIASGVALAGAATLFVVSPGSSAAPGLQANASAWRLEVSGQW